MDPANASSGELTPDERQQLEVWLEDFDRTWAKDRLASCVAQLPEQGPLRRAALCEFIKLDLRRHWQRGQRVVLESYLQTHPELGSVDTVAMDLIQAELKARRQAGDAASWKEYTERFPRQTQDMQRWFAEQMKGAANEPTKIEPVQPQTTPEGMLGTLKPSAGGRSDFESSTRPTEAHPARSDTPTPFTPAPGIAQAPMPELFGRYRIVKYLGGGAMGKVYLAQDTQLDRRVAMKIPFIKPDDSPEIMMRFYREAKAAATLHHPNICPVFDVGEIDKIPYLTMAYIEGPTLSEALRNQGPMPQQEAAQIVRKLAMALDEAHQHGVVHRDLKPSNIMMARGVGPVIMDFGLALRTDQDLRITNQGSVLGTPAYMSPEQVRGDVKTMGPGCDIYSLGVILYELLTGKVPFTGPMTEVLVRIVTEKPDPPSTHRPDIEPLLEAICLKAMAPQVTDRYRTMPDFAAALAEYLQTTSHLGGNYVATPGSVKRDVPDTYPDMTLADRGPKPKRRLVGVLVALLAVALLAAGAVAYFWPPSDTPTPPAKTDFEVQVRSDPAGAEVYIDGKKHEYLTPTSIKVPAGQYKLRLVRDGFKSWEQSVAVSAERADAVNHRFVALTQNIRITMRPDGVRVFIDNEEQRLGSNGALQTTVGSHRIKLEKPGFRTIEEKFVVQAGLDDQVFDYQLDRLRKLAFLVGVNRPSAALPDFLHAGGDVTTLARTLRTSGYEQVVSLTQPRDPSGKERPTAARVRKDFEEWVGQTTSADTVVVAFVGHAIQLPGDPANYFCPDGADPKKQDSLVSLTDVHEKLRQSPAQTKVLIIDGWRKHWQKIDGDPTRARPEQVVPTDGVVVMLSCAAGQRGWEHPEQRHGAFMQAVIEGLQSGTDKDLDQHVHWSELAEFVEARFVESTKSELSKYGPQTPQFIGVAHGDAGRLARVHEKMAQYYHGCLALDKAVREPDAKQQAKDLDAAMAAFDKLENELPGFAELHLKRAVVFFHRTQWDRAKDECEAALKIDPDNATAYALIAESILSKHVDTEELKKHIKTILDYHDKAIRQEPNYAPAYSTRGQLLYYLGKDYWQSAIDDFDRAIMLKPIRKEPYYYRGQTFLVKQEYQEAIDDCTRALKLDPKYYNAFVTRGLAHFYDRNYPFAVSDFSQAIEINKQALDPVYYRGRAYFLDNKHDKAFTDLEAVSSRDKKNVDAWLFMGRISWEQRKNADKALVYLKNALQDDTFADAWFHRGKVYLESGKDAKQAIKDFSKVIELDDRHPEVWLYRSKAKAAAGDAKGAAEDQKMHDKLKAEMKTGLEEPNRRAEWRGPNGTAVRLLHARRSVVLLGLDLVAL
jgi:tetratricopeptide (TPR) repeat protein